MAVACTNSRNFATPIWRLAFIGVLLAFAWPTGKSESVVFGDQPVAAVATLKPVIDATTLHHKVICGYQGWFRCPGDPAADGWKHWSRNRGRIGPDNLTFEMWPDMTAYATDEKYAAPGFTFPDKSPAQLFSSANAKTVARHFNWMQ